jgi:ADP-heptose:LPS heptosyltransferase
MLAWLLKGARLLISNDSGPVHMAAALGTPVISIFGRNQAGLSPIRWRPISVNSSFVQKDVGCIECLAHNCQIDFKCLKELRVEDVFEEARQYEPFLV